MASQKEYSFADYIKDGDYGEITFEQRRQLHLDYKSLDRTGGSIILDNNEESNKK